MALQEAADAPPKMLAYVRVSTDEQAQSGLGLEAQRARILQAADLRGWEDVRWFEDSASGLSTTRRPALQEALQEIERGDGLVVARLDRLARSTHDFSALVLRAQKEGWTLTCLDPDIDLSTPNGRLVAGVLALVAEWESGIIGQRVKEAYAAKRARGERVGSSPVIVPEVEALIGTLLPGRTYREVADELNALEIPTPRGGRLWRPSSIQRAVGRLATIEQ